MEYGYCQCGCGQKTNIAPRTDPKKKWIKGTPLRFVAHHGNPGRGSIAEAFFAYVRPGNRKDCWIWQGTLDKAGYGQVHFHGKIRKAHRLAHEIYFGDPGNLHVLHSCDNPSCVNPYHLSLGTNSDNIRDMTEKGRNLSNIRAESSLTPTNIQQIRKLFGQGKSQISIAKDYGISQSHVSRIVNGKRLKDVG